MSYCEENFAIKQEPGAEQAELQIRGALVERALDTSLPEMVNDVSRENQGHEEVLVHQQIAVNNAKENLKKAEFAKAKLEKELASVTREIFVLQEDMSKLEDVIESIGNDIDRKITENVENDMSLKNYEEEVKEEEKNLFSYVEKMKSFIRKVHAIERNYPLHQRIIEKKQQISELKQEISELKKETFSSHGKEDKEVIRSRLLNEIETFQREKAELEKEELILEEKISSEKSCQQSIQQNIAVLHKRNAAQLVRLKRQLKEAASRNQHWADQEQRLQKQLQFLKQQTSDNSS